MPPRSPALRALQPDASTGDTKARLLDAVVRLFAERGFHATSMRAITQLAGTSVSAANYHFGSKEGLLRAALIRRTQPLNVARLEALAQAETQARGGAEGIRAIVRAYILPLLEAASEIGEDAGPRRSLAARLYVDPPEVVRGVQEEIFAPVTQRFHDALQRAAGDVDPKAVDVALKLSLGVALHSIGGHLVWPTPAQDPLGAQKEKMIDGMVAFAAAGIVAFLDLESVGEIASGESHK
ncbi:MAG: TetR/AcrR family transcriptional regulator [Myxococcota bacterium]|nr:TetR/AcrR family transcriptional regulator [Myxococcota bacterium]